MVVVAMIVVQDVVLLPVAVVVVGVVVVGVVVVQVFMVMVLQVIVVVAVFLQLVVDMHMQLQYRNILDVQGMMISLFFLNQVQLDQVLLQDLQLMVMPFLMDQLGELCVMLLMK